MTRYELINDYITKRGYKKYLEIGVENPNNCFNHISCEYKVSVDPYFPTPYVDEKSSEALASMVTYRLTSDDFFAQNKEKFDIIFIDALHTEEQSTKDVLNAIKCLNDYGCILLHDCLPETERLQSDEAFESGEPWNGTVWKTISKLIKTGKYNIRTYYHDWGISVIEARIIDNGVINKIDELEKTDLDYKKDFSISNMNLEFSFLRNDYKVSYFTPAYKSQHISHTLNSLLSQTDPRWEWVVLDDSPSDYTGVKEFFEQIKDPRIHYYRLYPNSGGFIGKAKHRAVSLCEGILVAELDHDDEIDERTTEILLKLHRNKNSDFYYSDSYTYYVNEENKPMVVEYPEGFAMGYGSYKEDDLFIRWLNLHIRDKYVVSTNINPKTIRHIVGVPNHIRVWKRSFIDSIDSYDINLPYCDDYELIVRTFVNGGKMTKIDMPLYYQYMHNDNSQYERIQDIQNYVKAVSNFYHRNIKDVFESIRIDYIDEQIRKGTKEYIPPYFDYVYKHNNNDCNETYKVFPPSEFLDNLIYNDIVTKDEVLSLLKND